MKIYQLLAKNLNHYKRVESDSRYQVAAEVVIDRSDRLMETAPSGSGIDCGTTISDKSKKNRIVLDFGFHHMNECGMYDGWTNHTAVITADLEWGYELKITGKNRNDIKDYLHDVFNTWLSSDSSFDENNKLTVTII